MKCIGFQPSSVTLRIDWTTNLALAPDNNTSALVARRAMICDSTVGSVIS